MTRKFPKASRMREKLEKHFGISLPQIITKHLVAGMSRYKAADKIRRLMGWDGTAENTPFSTSSLWNIVEGARDHGETEFEFCGRKKNNKDYRQRQQETIALQPQKQPLKKKVEPVTTKELPTMETKEAPPAPVAAPVQIVLSYTCSHCGRSHEEKVNEILNANNILLRAHRCPACRAIGQCYVEFEYDGILSRKAVIFDRVAIHECFVDENNLKVENPFEEKEPQTT